MYLTKKIKKEIKALNNTESNIVNNLNGIALRCRDAYRKKSGIDNQYDDDKDYTKLYNSVKEIEDKFKKLSEKILVYAIEVIKDEDRQKQMNYVLKYRKESGMYAKQ